MELRLINDGEEYVTARGRVALTMAAPCVVVLCMKGHAPGAAVPKMIELLDRFGGARAPTDYFYDLWDMETYDSPVRVDLTAYHLKNRRNLRSLHTCTQSRIVRMGVTVAKLLLHEIREHDNRAAFDLALKRCIEASALDSARH